MAEIQWGLLRSPDPMSDFMSGAVAGRQQAAVNALRGYQANPSAAIQNLISAGDVQSASALANLQYQTAQRGLLTAATERLMNRGQPAQGAADAGATAQAQVDTDAASQKLEQLDTVAQVLQSIPYGPERKAALQQAAPQLTQIGFSPDQLSAFDPTDDRLERVREQVAQTHAQLGTGVEAPTSASSAPQSAPEQGGGLNIYDPETQGALQAVALADPQRAQALIGLGTAVAPKFEGGERPGTPIRDAHTGRIIGFVPNQDGVQYDVDAQGNITGSHVVPGYAKAEADYQGGIAGAKKHAEDAAHAPYEVVTVQMPDGSSQQMPLSDFQTLQRYGAAGKVGMGRSQTPGDAEFQKTDAQNFSKEVDEHGAGAIMPMQTARTNTEQAIKLAQAINPNAWTSSAAHIAGIINAATGGKIGAKEANDVSAYQALTQQVLRGSFSTFPRLEKEFEIVQKAAANVNTPKDAALVLLGSQAAVADRNLAYAQFVQNWTGPKSKQAMTQAFLRTPAGQASIFADPIWRGLQIAGKPAVMVGDKPMSDGHIYGVFRPGTPYAQTFRVQ